MSSAWSWCRSVLSWVLSSMSNASSVASSIQNRGETRRFPNMALAQDVPKSSRMIDEATRFWGSVEILKFSLKDLKIGGQKASLFDCCSLHVDSTLEFWVELESTILQTNLSCTLQDSMFLICFHFDVFILPQFYGLLSILPIFRSYQELIRQEAGIKWWERTCWNMRTWGCQEFTIVRNVCQTNLCIFIYYVTMMILILCIHYTINHIYTIYNRYKTRVQSTMRYL